MNRNSLANAPGKVSSFAKNAAHLSGLRPKQVAWMLPHAENRERGPPIIGGDENKNPHQDSFLSILIAKNGKTPMTVEKKRYFTHSAYGKAPSSGGEEEYCYRYFREVLPMETMVPAELQKAEEGVPTLTMKLGRTTYLIGLHFNNGAMETVDDALKRLIRKNVLEHKK